MFNGMCSIKTCKIIIVFVLLALAHSFFYTCDTDEDGIFMTY